MVTQRRGAVGEEPLEAIVVAGAVRWMPLIPRLLYPLKSDYPRPCNSHERLERQKTLLSGRNSVKSDTAEAIETFHPSFDFCFFLNPSG